MREFESLLQVLLVFLTVALYSSCAEQVDEDRDQALRESVVPAAIILDDTEGEPQLTRNFYFVIDGSGSMKKEDCGDEFDQRLQAAQWAVKEFLKSVPSDVNLGLFVFDSNGNREVVPLGLSNHQRFLDEVNAMDADGGTPLAASIRGGVNRLVEQYKRQLGYGEYRLIVVTDGDAHDLPAAAKYAMRYGIPIYTIGMCMEKDHPLSVYSVSYQPANSSGDLAAALKQTVAESAEFDPTVFEVLDPN